MADHKNCSGCGRSIPNFAPFCPHCGTKQARPMSEEEMSKDPYSILQVSENAEEEVIDAAYRGLAKKYHPDTSSGPKDQERMKEINWAYGILKDPLKRRQWAEQHKRDYPQDANDTSTTSSSSPKKPHRSGPSKSSASSNSTRATTTGSTTYQKTSSSRGGIKIWHVFLGIAAILILAPICSGIGSYTSSTSSASNSRLNPTRTTRPAPTKTIIPKVTPRPTNTSRPVTVNTSYQGGTPFGKPANKVADYLNRECFTFFEFTDGYYHDYYLMDGVGFIIQPDDDSRGGPVFGIGFMVDFSGDLTVEPNSDLLADIGGCIWAETGVPVADVFDWVANNSDNIGINGEDGYFGTVLNHFVGGFYNSSDEFMSVVITE